MLAPFLGKKSRLGGFPRSFDDCPLLNMPIEPMARTRSTVACGSPVAVDGFATAAGGLDGTVGVGVASGVGAGVTTISAVGVGDGSGGATAGRRMNKITDSISKMSDSIPGLYTRKSNTIRAAS